MIESIKKNLINDQKIRYSDEHKDFPKRALFLRVFPSIVILFSIIISSISYAYQLMYMSSDVILVPSIVFCIISLLLLLFSFLKIKPISLKTIQIINISTTIASLGINCLLLTVLFEQIDLSIWEKVIILSVPSTLLLCIITLFLRIFLNPIKVSKSPVIRIGTLGFVTAALLVASVSSGLGLENKGRKVMFNDDGSDVLASVSNGYVDYVMIPSRHGNKNVKVNLKSIDDAKVTNVYFENDQVYFIGSLGEFKNIKNIYYTEDFDADFIFLNYFAKTNASIHVTENTYVSMYDSINSNRKLDRNGDWFTILNKFEMIEPKNKYIFFDSSDSAQEIDAIKFEDSYEFKSSEHALDSYIGSDERTHLFDTWYENDKPVYSKTITETTILTNCFATVYNITYNLDDPETETLLDLEGNVAADNNQFFSRLDSKVDLFGGTKEGYHFGGWTESKTNLQRLFSVSPTSARDYNFYPVFDKIYPISYEDELGNVIPDMSDVTYYYDQDITIPECPESIIPTGYHFDYWDVTDAKSLKVIYQPGSKLGTKNFSGDLKFVAYFAPNTYNLTINYKDDEISPTMKYYSFTFASSYQITEPTRYGYDFIKLDTSQGFEMDLNGTWNWPDDVLAEVVWNPHILDITYDGNGGIPERYSDQVTFDDYLPALPNATREGYNFEGWSYKGNKVDINNVWRIDPIEEPFKAIWKAKEASVIFDGNGGTNPTDEVILTYDQPVPNLPRPERVGYDFDCWGYETDDILSGATWDKDVEGLITFVANWTPKKYTINFDGNGAENPSETLVVYYDGSVPELPTVERVGYNFAGWMFDKKVYKEGDLWNTDADSNITFVASWTPKKYIIRFDGNGGTNPSETCEVYYDGSVPELPVSQREGYSFAGWTYKGENIKNGDIWTIDTNEEIVFKAQWSPNTYYSNVYSSINGELIQSFQWTFGEYYSILLSPPQGYSLSNLTLNDKEFSSTGIWNISHDVDVVANFIPCQYAVRFYENGSEITDLIVVTFNSYYSLPSKIDDRDVIGWKRQDNGEEVPMEGIWNIPIDNLKLNPIWAE